MKFSFIKNDKTTVWDEVILSIIIIVLFTVGITLCVLRPTFWIVEESTIVVLGVLMITMGIMYIPGLIYRLMTNEKSK